MTDITELAQREKFEAWLSEKPLHARYIHWSNTLNAYDYTGIQLAWEAYQAGGTELAETLNKAQCYIEELREWNAGLAQESFERQQRISELLEGKVGNALLERENHHVEVVGKLTEHITELESEVEKWKQEAETWEQVADKQLATAIALESRTVKLPKFKMLEDYLSEVAVEERKAILLGVKMEFHRR
ncbi:hypothetical protein [Klebsiella quasipneumoniae]|uniref:hypothetical protein n=1 Tax=Klebsiella quasipneumoniae TaxID=1463165 RepID=UPI0010332828|nr:hypothetical protein [Klebsiella quasipneumoniae]